MKIIMEILQLRYFYDSANNGSFSKTAEKYMVPISSVSASVRRLEKELNCKLFDRSCNRIMLNKNGKRLEQTLRSVFAQLDETVEELSSADVDNREIKILVRAMRSAVTDYIIEYGKNYPHITFKTVFDFGETDFASYDIIIDEKTGMYPGYESFELYNMRIRLQVAANSPLLERKLTMRQLSNQPFISLGEQSNMHRMLINACNRAGFDPKVVALVNDMLCHEKMIASGMGIGLGRENSQLSSNIRHLDVSDFNERYIVCAYYKKSSAYGNIKRFLTFLEKSNG